METKPVWQQIIVKVGACYVVAVHKLVSFFQPLSIMGGEKLWKSIVEKQK